MLQGNLDEAERYLKQALREARRAFDSKDAHVAAALNNLAEVYRCLLRERLELSEGVWPV